LAGGSYDGVLSGIAELDKASYSSDGCLTAMLFEEEPLRGDDSAATFTLTKESLLICIKRLWLLYCSTLGPSTR
jgi:hypothetical protein